ncbi:MAG TPA: phytoene desaturase family protein [Cytophagaceae bacterium]|nr:phytoene desaturase family protein [Cytophagaceae bacterium]
MSKKVLVIGSGFAGIASAALLAKKGYDVTVLEKNSSLGGRARQMVKDGYYFDMGPSWYWMPEIFDDFFKHFGKKATDFYELERLDPSYRVYFGQDDFVDIPASLDGVYQLFERIEKGSSEGLNKFLEEAKYKYEIGMGEFVHKPSLSIMEFVDLRIFKSLFKMQLLTSITNHIKQFTSNKKLLSLLEFPVLFLGAKPQDTPALYSMMNYSDIVLGTWYPHGGMYSVVKAMVKVAEDQGVKFRVNENVEKINVKNGRAYSVTSNGKEIQADVVVAAADYAHVDQHLLSPEHRRYSAKYWDTRKLAPSCLLYYIGLDKKLNNILHHTLFFDADFNQHAAEIYDHPQWPSDPLLYTSCPSQNDPTLAPPGKDILFVLIPVAVDLKDTPEIREKYLAMALERVEKRLGQSIRPHIVVKESYAYSDFVKDYNSLKGNAYGLANTIMQTAFLKPSMKSKKVKNLYYTGQLTVPGPGVPPCLISGEVVANLVEKENGV